MAEQTPNEIRTRLALLAGGQSRAPDEFADFFDYVCGEVDSLDTVTIDQLNRLLIAAGFNRVGRDFFEYFVSLGDTFDARLGTWRVRAMLRFGGFRYPFRNYSEATRDELCVLLDPAPHDVSGRGASLALIAIPLADTPLLGEANRETAETLRDQSELTEADSRYIERFDRARSNGRRNLDQYCVSEYLDVYIATSMRAAEDYYAVGRFIRELSGGLAGSDLLSSLVFFDPTQAWHPDRVAKGIVEGLMLRRAVCTIYMGQEQDTLGKASELSTTLVQGKPAVAYFPKVDDQQSFQAQLLSDLQTAAEDDPIARNTENPLWRRLEARYRELLPHDWARTATAQRGTGIESQAEFDEVLDDFAQRLAGLYDRRAAFLQRQHPLGVQVALASGVPNGVLVVRTVEHCQEIVRGIVRDDLEFTIRGPSRSGPGGGVTSDLDAPVEADRYLVESTTGCIYRVALGETLVSNSFWNWYPSPE